VDTIQQQILDLPIEEIEKMNLLSQLEKDIRQKGHWDEKERHFLTRESHMQLQKWIWAGTVVLLALGIMFK